ncbi:uncharacterized protein LOC107800424 [Nicotiana tabacum]|uniref:Uncharacterized protein LOC107800424 n=3 Tax=Nicotiana tabacum TaxID=4097 RepID=A0AC58UJD0_TOBAC
MEKGKDICNPLVIHEIGCRSGTSDHCVLTLSTVPTKDLDQPEVDSCGQGIAGLSSDQIEIQVFLNPIAGIGLSEAESLEFSKVVAGVHNTAFLPLDVLGMYLAYFRT